MVGLVATTPTTTPAQQHQQQHQQQQQQQEEGHSRVGVSSDWHKVSEIGVGKGIVWLVS